MLDITEQKKSRDWHSGVAPNITKISNHCCMICKKNIKYKNENISTDKVTRAITTYIPL